MVISKKVLVTNLLNIYLDRSIFLHLIGLGGWNHIFRNVKQTSDFEILSLEIVI